MSRRPNLPCRPLLLALALAVPAFAQAPDVQNVSPNKGTIGTELVIQGSGLAEFGAPRLWLEWKGDGEPKKSRLRVVSFSDVEVRAVVMQAQLGVADLKVKALRKPPVQVQDAFEVVPPQVSGVAPLAAQPGAEVVLSGDYFGSRRPKVRLFLQPCKIMSWSDDAVTFKVPPSTPNGEWTPRFENKLGEAIAPLALAVSGSEAPVPPQWVEALVEGQAFFAGAADVVAANLGSKLAFDAYAESAEKLQHESVLVPFAPVSGKLPKVFSGSNAGGTPLFYQEALLGSSPPSSSLYVVKPATLPWKLIVLGRSQGHLFGCFEAVLQKSSGSGAATITMDEGWFFVDY